ncbi:PA14 domain-containing protein [uncultured Hymenobacter sp.]|uniref:PA14 domain-containing protein n=1 Tax=uncultured Hymenobacter sp. TaxID=170016 RepID=UPI0035CB6B70
MEVVPALGGGQPRTLPPIMHRRHFIQTSAAASLPLVIGRMPAQAHPTTPELAAVTGAAQPTDRVLVLIYLQGGNDGLNTIIPRDKYSELMRVRANVMIPESKVLALTAETGLHPAMTGVRDLYKDGKLGIVQGVHSAVPDGSHFQATNIMFSGLDSNQLFRTGWLGRYLSTEYPNFPEAYPNADMPDPLAITLGGMASNLCQSTVVNTSISVRDLDDLRQLADGPSGALPATPMGREVGYLRQVVASLNAYSSTIKNATTKARSLSTKYPSNNFLAEQLKVVAQLVGGGLRTRVYVCHAYGFDTHANQVESYDHTSGSHALLLKQLSEALAGFQDDLSLLGIEDRVVGMTVSEFGRRIASSDSLGTDHGEAAPVLLFGTNINPVIHGRSPDVASSTTGSVPMQYDFRTLYTSILQDWFQVSPATLQDLFPSQNTPGGFPYLPVIKPSLSTHTPAAPVVGTGQGLTGVYYEGLNFDTLRHTRLDATIDFNWGTAPPAPDVSSNQFSVRWTGQILPLYTGEYTFYVNSDNGRRLWVNDELIINAWVNDWDREYAGKVRLTAGQKVNIRLEYFDDAGLASARLEWASAAQPRQVVPRSQLFAQAPAESMLDAGAGDGLTAAYYNGLSFETLQLTRIDPVIDFDWRLGSPAPGVSANQFSVRWTGQMLPRHSEEYTFHFNADDGRRLWINGQLIIDAWADSWPVVSSGPGTAWLQAGQKADIRVEYYENGGMAKARLEWSSASQDRELVPQSQLFSAAAASSRAAVAQMVAVRAADNQVARPAIAGLSVYPNPVRNVATLSFEGTGAPGRVVLCDLSGREVRVLAQGAMQGPQAVHLDAANLPAGSYFCRIEQGRTVRTVRVQVSR